MTNDGGGCWVVDEPMGIDHLHNQVDMLVGTQVDTLCWNVGPPGGYRYDTKVSTRYGQGLDQMPQARLYRARENLEAMLRQGLDPLAVLIERGKQNGIRVYPSLRISDCQMGGDLDPLSREHPQWRIGQQPRYGPVAQYPVGIPSYDDQLDFAHAQVRQRMIDVVDELLNRYGVDGIELDFQRRPHYFKPDDAIASCHLMTDMLRSMRQSADQAAKAQGKKVEVICRVWMDLDDCWNLGMDVRTWVAEGLLDMVMPTNHYYFALDYPIEQFVELVQGTPIRVAVAYCPLLNQIPKGAYPEHWPGCTAAGRPVMPDALFLITKPMWYAAAQVALSKGAHALSTFNFNEAPRKGGTWDRSILDELADPVFVAGQDKLYPYLTGESRNRPAPLGHDPVTYELYVGDDPAAASHLILEVCITQTTTMDRLAFQVNGKVLESTRRLACPDVSGGLQAPEVDPHHLFVCSLTGDQVRKGYNKLQIQLIERNPSVGSALTVVGVNLLVEYET